jgi:hypothetical protein
MGSAPKDGLAHSSHHEMNKEHGTPNGFRTSEGQQTGPDTSAGGMPCNEQHYGEGSGMPESHSETESPDDVQEPSDTE